MNITVKNGIKVTLNGVCLCRKCGARFQPEELLVGDMISNVFIQRPGGQMRQCPNPDCSHILLDFTNGLNMSEFMCQGLEIG